MEFAPNRIVESIVANTFLLLDVFIIQLWSDRVLAPYTCTMERWSAKTMLLIRSETSLLVPAGEEFMTLNQFKIPGQTSRLVFGLCVLSLLFGCTADSDRADYREHDIATLQALMQQGELSSRQLTQYYLDRIDATPDFVV